MPGPLAQNTSSVWIKYVVNNTGLVPLLNVTLTSTAGDLPTLGRDLGPVFFLKKGLALVGCLRETANQGKAFKT